MNWKPSFGNIAYLFGGAIIGLAIGLLIVRGLSDLSVVFAGLGLLLLVGQVGVGYRQTRGEEAARVEGRAHELRIRNDDLFAAHSRDLAAWTFAPLTDAAIEEAPKCVLLVRIPDRPSSAPSVVGALWNWDAGLQHLRADPLIEPSWRQIEESMRSFAEAYGAWERMFRQRLDESLSARLGAGFAVGNPWGTNPPEKGFQPDQFWFSVRQGLKGLNLGALRAIEVAPGVSGVSTGGLNPLVYSPAATPFDPAHVMLVLTDLCGDSELRRLLATEDASLATAKQALETNRYSLRVHAARVQMSGRVAGDCDVCKQLRPRISG